MTSCNAPVSQTFARLTTMQVSARAAMSDTSSSLGSAISKKRREFLMLDAAPGTGSTRRALSAQSTGSLAAAKIESVCPFQISAPPTMMLVVAQAAMKATSSLLEGVQRKKTRR